MEFVLQLVTGDEGVTVGFRQIHNAVEIVHGGTKRRKDGADSNPDHGSNAKLANPRTDGSLSHELR